MASAAGGGKPCIALALRPAAACRRRARPLRRLLVLGDSLSAGYGLPHEPTGSRRSCGRVCARSGHDVAIIDGAVSGDTSAGGLARLDWALGDGADAAIVELGANDGLRGVDPADTETNLTAILDRLAARHIPVLLSGMYAMPNLGPDYADGVPRGVRPAREAARRAVRSVLPARTWRPCRRSTSLTACIPTPRA